MSMINGLPEYREGYVHPREFNPDTLGRAANIDPATVRSEIEATLERQERLAKNVANRGGEIAVADTVNIENSAYMSRINPDNYRGEAPRATSDRPGFYTEQPEPLPERFNPDAYVGPAPELPVQSIEDYR